MTAQMDFGDGLRWVKATRSGGTGSDCLYAARDPRTNMIGIRDCKQGRDGSPQWYTHDEWAGFLDGAKSGEFDHLLD